MFIVNRDGCGYVYFTYLSGSLQALSDIPLNSKYGTALVPALRTQFEAFPNEMTALFVDLRQELIKF